MFEGHHYQNAYIVADMEAALAQFGARAGRGDTRIYDIEQILDTPAGRKKVATRLAFAWIGDLQYEFIEVTEDETGIYGNWADNGPSGGPGKLHFHHACMRVEGDWDSFRARVAAQDLPVVMERANPEDPLKFLYLDARAVCGHYLEYCWMTEERWQQMRAM